MPELEEALRTLRRDELEVLLLFAWADLSYDEIAAVTDVPVGTVRSRLHRARSTLRAALGGPPRHPKGVTARDDIRA